MNEYDYEKKNDMYPVTPKHEALHMANEFDTPLKTTGSSADFTHGSYTGSDNRTYYKETIKPQKAKAGGFKKFVIGALVAALVGAPLLGLGMGAGQIIAGNYLDRKNQSAENTLPERVIEQKGGDAAVSVEKSGVKRIVDNSTLAGVIKSSQKSVVNITTKIYNNDYYDFFFGPDRGVGAGSGIVIGSDDEHFYIMTNYHVVQDATKAYISFVDMEQIPASAVGGSREDDIAIIKVKKLDLETEGISSDEITIAEIGDSEDLEVGDSVIAIGNSMGNGKTATSGIISALNRNLDFEDDEQEPLTFIQTDAAINPGNSGGALVNMDGEVIGMNTAKIADYQVEGMGFAIPSNTFSLIIDDVLNSTTGPRPFIGIYGQNIDSDLVEEYSLITPTGILVTETVEGGGASDAGIRPGDIITEFNGKKVTKIEEVQEAVKSMEIGSKIPTKIIRNNERELEISIEIKDSFEIAPW